MKLFGFLSIAGLALLSVACGGKPNILVVDPSGKPLEDATIVPLTRAYSKQAEQTNAEGRAQVYQDFPPIEWLNVTKRGYQSAHVSFEQPKPMTVTLRPTSQ